MAAIGYSTGDNIYENLTNTAVGNLILVCAGSIPGYWLAVALVDTMGRKTIQIMGFFILTIIFVIVGFAYHQLSDRALLGLYILAQVFFNFGPNTTTFIVPGECFPTRYRSTGHGVSAAGGKIGAIVAQVIAQPLLVRDANSGCSGSDCSPWLNHLMQIFALFMLMGFLVSFLVPETKGRTLEELAGEGAEGATALDHGGSVILSGHGVGGWMRRNNPFNGGAPAGFNYVRSPHLGPRSPGIIGLIGIGGGKRERMGIMSSPELIPKKKSKGWLGPGQGHDRDAHSEGSRSVSDHGRNGVKVEDNDDLYLAGAGGALPGWGAGWGVQRNDDVRREVRRDGRMESIMLQDVGMLLK